MSKETSNSAEDVDLYETANDRFKKSFSSWFWSSMVVATFVHFAFLAFFPDLQASNLSFTMEELTAIELPPEIEIPPPPEQISRPASPVVTDAQIDDDITIAPTTFEDNPISDLPPPPTQGTVDISSQPVFTPFEVAPELRNAAEVQRILEREYPAMLRDAGVGGTVVVHFFINEEGIVQNSLIHESSGQSQLDDAAMRAALQFRFTPALNRETPVPVWVSIPVTFQSN
ncbi:MAG: energy transducer TonB [Gemmatimonadota bacterium]